MTGEMQGRRYAVINFINGGQGGGENHHGTSTISFPSNVGNTPIEVMETNAPVRVLKRERLRGSGGGGRFPGGDGSVLEFEVTSENPAVISFILSRVLTPAPGLQGGGDGRRGKLTINGKPIDAAEHQVVKKGDRVVMQTASGGGFGRSA